MIVLDASAAVDLLLRVEPQGSSIRERLSVPGETLHTLHLFDAEVVQAIRRHEFLGAATEDRAREALGDFRDLSVTRYPYVPFLDRVWELRHNISAFDAAYVALAEALDAPLVTCDGRLANAPGHTARIELFD